MRIVIAPQEFKGTLTAREAAEAMAKGARRALPDAELEIVPLSDGGPGFVEAALAGAPGRRIITTVHGPVDRPIEAAWALLADGTAVIEMAAAAGLALIPDHERRPDITSTFGVGELIRAALDEGARSVIAGLGGSATNDGGAGMASALGVRFLDAEGRELPPGGAALARLAAIDVSGLDRRVREARFFAAADVANPLCGPEGASAVYGPQKGAPPQMARALDAALRRYAEVIERDLGVSVTEVPGAGAAGGLGAGMIAFLGAKVQSGFEVIAELAGLRERLRGADLLVTGEGRLDAQTAYGKTVARAARLARELNVPVLVVPGSLGEGWGAIFPLAGAVEPVAGGAATLEDALARPAQTLASATRRAISSWARIMGVIGAG
jgi:glycerate kinase